MIRAAFCLLLALSGPVGAACFSTASGHLPKRATFDNGAVVDFVARDRDVLTYSNKAGSETMVTRMRAGLYTLDHRTPSDSGSYTWRGAQPDLAGIAAAGGRVRVKGTFTGSGLPSVPAAVEVEILGKHGVEWDGCRYEAFEFRKRSFIDGKLRADAVVLFAPDPMIVFRNAAFDMNGPQPFAFVLADLK